LIQDTFPNLSQPMSYFPKVLNVSITSWQFKKLIYDMSVKSAFLKQACDSF